MPTATTITIEETLDLLDGPLNSFSQGFQTGLYALWLGSGISRERVVGLDGVLAKLLENLRFRITGVGCEHHHAAERTLRGLGKQVVVAVHERALFEYLTLELSPAFVGDSLITVEISRNFAGDAVADPHFYAFEDDKVVAA